MQDSIQEKVKEKMLQGEATGNYVPANTHIEQYSRSSSYVRRERMLLSFERCTPSNFHEAHPMGICFKCLRKWEPKHKCKPGAVWENVRDRLKSVESLVRLVPFLVDATEDDEDHEQGEAASTALAQIQQHFKNLTPTTSSIRLQLPLVNPRNRSMKRFSRST